MIISTYVRIQPSGNENVMIWPGDNIIIVSEILWLDDRVDVVIWQDDNIAINVWHYHLAEWSWTFGVLFWLYEKTDVLIYLDNNTLLSD
jgi:hypothetical protein